LNPEADPEDPAIFRAFTEIHQVSNEEVRNYVKKRRTKIEQARILKKSLFNGCIHQIG
jgi:hypothetical protein